MMHNFVGLIYFSVKQINYEQKYKSITPPPIICLLKNENQMWEEVLKNREFKEDSEKQNPDKNIDNKQAPSEENVMRMNMRASEEEELDMWGVLYTEKEYDTTNQYKKIDKKRKVAINCLCEALCEETANFQIRLFSQEKNQYVGICSFPLEKIQNMPKIKHQLQIQLVNFKTYTQLNELNQQFDAYQLFGESQNEPRLQKQFLEEFEQKFQKQVKQHKIIKHKKHEKVAKLSLDMVYVNKSYGKLIFEAFEIIPKSSMGFLTDLMEPQLIIRVDNREVRSSTYKIFNKVKIIWYKSVAFELDRIPTKITITLFNKQNEAQEGVANMSVFITNLMLPTKRAKKEIVKLFDENPQSQNAKVIGQVFVKHRFVPSPL